MFFDPTSCSTSYLYPSPIKYLQQLHPSYSVTHHSAHTPFLLTYFPSSHSFTSPSCLLTHPPSCSLTHPPPVQSPPLLLSHHLLLTHPPPAHSPLSCSLCNQSFLNKNASSADESSAKVLFKHPSTTFVYTKT